ncbi:MAG: PD-(D/E)XK nuclease family protein [Actinomycetota bacterium]
MSVGPLETDSARARVLDHASGPLLVTGPPGSGKTTLLRERAVRLVERGADPSRVALFVLSRRAAREAHDALIQRLARSLPEVPVFTVHGFAYRVIGRRFGDLGYAEPPQVLSAPEQYAVVRELLAGERDADWPTFGRLLGVRGFAQQVADVVLRAQERLLGPEDLEAAAERAGRDEYREVAAFYGRYLDAQLSAGRADFAGLLLQAATLLRRDLSEEEAYPHVLVDDYQDVTFATEGILESLGRAAETVVVAADPPGHVFAYRGGSRVPLSRLDRTLPGLRRVELTEVHRRGIEPAALRRLDEPRAPDGDPPEPGVEALAFDHPGEEADAAAHELLRARVEDGVPWESMAIIVRRYGEYLTALRHALNRHDVPFVVVAEAAAVASEPANRPVIDLFRYVLRHDEREQLLERLLLSPVVGLDPHALRRLRREARLRDVSLLALVEEPPADLPEDLGQAVGGFGALVGDLGRDAARLGPDALFYQVWARLPWFRDLVGSEGPSRDLDALAALAEVLSRFVERRPGATTAEYLDTLDAAEFGPDPWIPPEERRPHAVRIVSAHRAHGMECDVTVVVGCLEGEFPSLGHGEALVDLESLVDPKPAAERMRERLASERALFRLAISRARRRTVLTASRSTSARNPRTPTRFAARLGLDWDRATEEVPPAASLVTLEASLRRSLADGAAPRVERLASLAALPAAGAEPHTWWGGRDWTDPGEPLHAGEIRTSYSRFGTLENCALQYLYGVEMGLDPERSHQMWVGTLIHDIVDRAQRGELERSEEAVLGALDEVWRQEVFPNRALERQRYLDAQKMLRLWLADETLGEPIESEVGFEFPIDGAVVRGRIDAVYRFGEGGTRVVDYKTSRYTPTQDQVQASLQLGAYYLAMKRVPELAELGEPRLLELAYLFAESSDGGYKHMSVKPERMGTGEYEAWAEGTILELLETVRAERFAPSPEADCMWCRFKPICPVWPQGAEVAP